MTNKLPKNILKSIRINPVRAKELIQEEERIADLRKISGLNEYEVKEKLKSSNYRYEFIREFYMRYGRFPD